ncbi:malonate decarboxylase epsilon subunit [Gordonia namibiensis NBRC 108229]|uniref:[acyl-carrier-protein] S-malonyltransferase n=1 Tax=Gordonia namibiensis NBRC 108229 TaxID=1208314 RepID=K6X2R3_9ACTN|nr:acyltransferase domain-containing protein [Gordonia namibiensis]GAB98667.1 malonate decarboxylase epsilon subunit [Gordonia namibiensis NBRC 108229]
MSLALLFPGQGAQHPNMLRDLPDSPAVASTLHESGCRAEALDSDTALKDTSSVQLALLIAGVAGARALTEDQGLIPQFVAGHSVGAFAAAVTAGVLTLAEAVAAVGLRGRLMEQACAQGDWGMLALTGLPTRVAVELVSQIATEHVPLWVANVNSATETVLSGSASALQAATSAAQRAGALNSRRLDVAVASHCPVQEDTARHMAEQLASVPRRTLTARCLTNTTGRVATSADAVLDDLAQAVSRPVQWYDATRLMGELGVTCVVETEPGHVLTQLFSSAVPSVLAISLADAGLSATVDRAHRTLRSEQPR